MKKQQTNWAPDVKKGLDFFRQQKQRNEQMRQEQAHRKTTGRDNGV
ncbi:MAG: hypothetical protein ABJM06_00610 [Gilvibacter sp.]